MTERGFRPSEFDAGVAKAQQQMGQVLIETVFPIAQRVFARVPEIAGQGVSLARGFLTSFQSDQMRML